VTGVEATAVIVAPIDLLGDRAGGIKSFVAGFAKFAPPMLRVECVALTTTAGGPLRVGTWQRIDVEGRPISVLPVLADTDPPHHSALPLSLRFIAACTRLRGKVATADRVLQFHRPATVLPFLGARAPKIQLIHHERAQLRPGGESGWARMPRLFNVMEAITSRTVDAVVAVNEETAEQFAARHPGASRITRFVPNWVDDTIFFSASTAERARWRQELAERLGGSEGDPIVLCVGRLEATKDPLLAMDAFGLLAAADERVRFVIAGAGSLASAISARAAQLGLASRVRLLGVLARPDLARLMNAADVLLVASLSETGPTTVLEALACGLPVVAPTVGRIPRVVQNGRNGWIAADRKPESLAEGLRWALSAPADARAAAREAAAPYRARLVLAPLFDLHFELLERASSKVRP
jgi:glycosyltransferase involved in cell wall biosynthesis